MSEIISIVTVRERAFQWAKAEQEFYFPKPDRFHLTELDKFQDKYDSHISLYTDGKTTILRVFWLSTNSVKYSLITNFPELKESHPELTEQLLRNGEYAYTQHVSDMNNLK